MTEFVIFSNLKLNIFWFKFVKKEIMILSSFDFTLVFHQKVGENVDFCQELQNNPKTLISKSASTPIASRNCTSVKKNKQ